MTYNVSGGTLNLAQLRLVCNFVNVYKKPCKWLLNICMNMATINNAHMIPKSR